MINDVTPELGLPLPHPANDLADDVGRLRAALGAIDALVAAMETGKASLVGGKVPAGQLPAFVDDVIEVADFAALPALGESGKIYVAVNNPPSSPSRQYRWGGSTYTEINPSPGSTDAVPEGIANLYFTAARARAAMQVATSSQLGVVKVGNGLSVDAEGAVSINGTLMAFTVIPLPITSNGQTAFTVTGGYTVGAIEVLLNGIELAADDYTASNGTTLVLAVGASTADALWVRRWRTFDVANAYTKAEADLVARPFNNNAALAQAQAIALCF